MMCLLHVLSWLYTTATTRACRCGGPCGLRVPRRYATTAPIHPLCKAVRRA